MSIKTIDIRQARIRLPAQEGQTILEAALQHGVCYPHGCRSGRCGSCKTRLIEGEVDMLQHTRYALTDEERAGGFILACRAVPRTDVAVAWLGDDDEAAAAPAQAFEATIVALDDLTHDIKRLRVRPDGAAPDFAAGQYADIRFGQLPARSYSMANRPGEPELEFHIRRVPGGVVSSHLHTAVRAGDRVALQAPRGASHLRACHRGPMLCIAGGSGLAPIKSIVETALAHGMQQAIHVYFGARAQQDLYLLDHFEALVRRHRNLVFIPVLSEARSDTHRVGFVTRAAADDLPDLRGWKAYVAGPPTMVEAAMQMACSRGLGAQDMHADVFYTPETSAA